MQDSRERVDEIYQRLKSGGFEAEPPREFHGAWTFYLRARAVSSSRSGTSTGGAGTCKNPGCHEPIPGLGRLPSRRPAGRGLDRETVVEAEAAAGFEPPTRAVNARSRRRCMKRS